jgi:hypothetical protein
LIIGLATAAGGAPRPAQAQTATPPPCRISFRDVPVEYWANGYIEWAYCNGVVSGYSDGTFRPEATTTRSQIAKMVVVAARFPLTLPAGAPHFADVPPASPFYVYVEVAWNHGILSGYADGTFQPGSPVTRAQLAKMIVVARGLTATAPATATFADVPASHWAYGYVERAFERAIVSGYVCGGAGEPCPGVYVRPEALATRAQLCKMLFQAFNVPS